MINIPPIKPSTEIKSELLPDVTRVWKVGQILNASVDKGGEALSKILLRIGNQQVETRTPLPLQTGDQLKLLVKSLGPEPLLQIQGQPQTINLAASQLKLFIAAQTSISPLLEVAQQPLTVAQLPAPVRQSLQNLFQSVPQLTELIQAPLLKLATVQSGAFLESLLLRNPQQLNLSQDIKAGLLSLANNIRASLPTQALAGPSPQTPATETTQQIQSLITQVVNTGFSVNAVANSLSALLNPPQLKQLVTLMTQLILGQSIDTESAGLAQAVKQATQGLQHLQLAPHQLELLQHLLQQHAVLKELHQLTEHSLARITSHQLTPLTREGDNALLLLFDLPFRFKDQLHLIEFMLEEEKHGVDSASSWSVTLNFQFDPLGPVEARLHLIEHQLSARFMAESASTVSLIQKHLPLLESALDKAGFLVASVDVSQQKPSPRPGIKSDSHLLDEQA